MAFRAVHAEWGAVFTHLPDLGCGQAWEAVWKVRPPAPIVCAECRHPMHAKTSERGLRFFAHAPHAPDCEIARQGESEAHHLLKLELASAARDAGAHAELEVRAPDGSWSGRRRGEWVVRPPDTDSAGAWDVVGVLEVAEVGVRLGDGFGVRLLLRVLGERPVDARDAGGLPLALAGGDDQVGLDLLGRLALRAAAEHGVQHVLGDDG